MHTFPDMSPEVGRLRASFDQVKAELRNAGVSYSMFNPARLTVTLDSTRHSFTDPCYAEKFIKANITHPSEDS